MRGLGTTALILCVQMVEIYSMNRKSPSWSKAEYQMNLCALNSRERQSPQIFITVSSLSNLTTQRLLELNWYNAKPKVGDWLGLFNRNPHTYSNFWKRGLLFKTNVTKPSGFIRSTSTFPYYRFSRSYLRFMKRKTECLGFWIAYLDRFGAILNSQCFHSNPNWMWNHRTAIGDFRLWEMLIPGAHNAGAYTDSLTENVQNVVNSYLFTHHDNLYNMLNYGIRYFDLRIGYVPLLTDTFWLTHGPGPLNPLKNALDDIKQFLQFSKEILILDFHSFVGFLNDGQHEQLLKFTKEFIGDYLLYDDVEGGINITVNQIWKTGKKILLFYNDKFAAKKNELWPGIKQMWGNKQDIVELKEYIDEVMEGPQRTYVWPVMAELTEDIPYLLQHLDEGVGQMADDINRNLTEWVRELWWRKANIIAMDFSLGSNVINVAIDANLRRKCYNRYGFNETESPMMLNAAM